MISALLSALLVLASPAAAEAPWSIDLRHPIAPRTRAVAEASSATTKVATSALDAFADGALWVWTNVLSPVDGPTCGFHPTCSGYAKKAIRRHGWLLGGAMAAERIMRNHVAAQDYDVRRVNGVLRMLDPVPE